MFFFLFFFVLPIWYCVACFLNDLYTLVLDISAFSTPRDSDSIRCIFCVFQATTHVSYGTPDSRKFEKAKVLLLSVLIDLCLVLCCIYWHVCCLYLQGLRLSPAPKRTRLLMERRARSSASSAARLLPTASWVPLSTLFQNSSHFLTALRCAWTLSPRVCGDFISFDRLSPVMYSTLTTYDTHNKWDCILNHLFSQCVL